LTLRLKQAHGHQRKSRVSLRLKGYMGIGNYVKVRAQTIEGEFPDSCITCSDLSRWNRIAKMIKGRTENAVKNRFNSASFRRWKDAVDGCLKLDDAAQRGGAGEVARSNLGILRLDRAHTYDDGCAAAPRGRTDARLAATFQRSHSSDVDSVSWDSARSPRKRSRKEMNLSPTIQHSHGIEFPDIERAYSAPVSTSSVGSESRSPSLSESTSHDEDDRSCCITKASAQLDPIEDKDSKDGTTHPVSFVAGDLVARSLPVSSIGKNYDRPDNKAVESAGSDLASHTKVQSTNQKSPLDLLRQELSCIQRQRRELENFESELTQRIKKMESEEVPCEPKKSR